MPGEYRCKSFVHLVEDTECLALRAKSKKQLFLCGLYNLLPDLSLEKTVSEESHAPKRMKANQQSVMGDKNIPL